MISNARQANYTYFRKQFSAFPTQSKILDVGAGRGRYKEFIPEFTNITTLDNGPYPGIDVVHDLKDPLPFPDNSFDIILLSNVLEHFENTEQLLKECRRVLKKGGFVIGAVPFMIQIHQEPRDFYRFTLYGLEYHFKNAGYQNVSVEPLGLGVHTYTTMQRIFFEDIRLQANRRRGILSRVASRLMVLSHDIMNGAFRRLYSLASGDKYRESYGFSAKK